MGRILSPTRNDDASATLAVKPIERFGWDDLSTLANPRHTDMVVDNHDIPCFSADIGHHAGSITRFEHNSSTNNGSYRTSSDSSRGV